MEPEKIGYLAILRQKSFSLYFIGQIASSISDGLYMTVIIFLSLQSEPLRLNWASLDSVGFFREYY